MRIAIRILALVSIALSAIAVGLSYGGFGFSDTDPLFGVVILASLGSALVAFSTFILGAIAAAMRRQWVWLIGLTVVGLLVVAGPFVASQLAQSAVNSTNSIPACQTAYQTAPECQPSATQLLLLNLQGILTISAPMLVGLAALIYSFRMREAPVPALAPRS